MLDLNRRAIHHDANHLGLVGLNDPAENILIMPDFYIRTPDNAESRGPFDEAKLLTLAEAGQIDANTLYFDEDKEEWVPIALNEPLKEKVFPKVKKLALKIGSPSEETTSKPIDDEAGGLNVEEMLAAAEGDTRETKHKKALEKSKDKAASIATAGIGLVMLGTALTFLVPHLGVLNDTIGAETYASIVNYPFLMVGLFDFVMAIFLFLAVTEVYPAIRFRAAVGLGFGIYIGWALGDPILLGAWALGSVGMFVSTLSARYSTMLLALTIGIGGNAYLAYLALNGDLTGFFETTTLNLISE